MGDEGRARKRFIVATLFGVLAVLAVLTFFGGTSADYVGSEECNECHDDIYPLWEGVFHGIDFANDWNYHGESGVNKYTLYGSDAANGTFGPCASCHVTGWDDTEQGGVKTDEPWNSTHNKPLMRIGCENCHGPGSDHVDDRDNEMLLLDEFTYSLSCSGWGTTSNDDRMGSCHDGGRQGGTDEVEGYYDSGHVSGVPEFVKGNIDCYHCMASDGFIRMTVNEEEVTEVPEDALYKVTCGACHDPHPEEGDADEHGQLRISEEEICEKCHYNTHEYPSDHVRHPTTEFRDGENGKGVPQIDYMAEVSCPDCHMWSSDFRAEPPHLVVGHRFHATPQACVECHSMYTNTTAWEYVEAIQAEYTALMTPFGNATTGLMGDVHTRMEWAKENDLWTNEHNTTYNDALWNYQYPTEDGSHGAHNPVFMREMFGAAKMGFESILMDTNMGGVSGEIKWKDGGAIEEAKVMDSTGATLATTDGDGKFFFWYDVGTWTFIVKDKDDMAAGTMSVEVTLMQNVTADQEFEEPTGEGGDTTSLTYIFLGIIVVLIIIIIAVAMMGGPKGGE